MKELTPEQLANEVRADVEKARVAALPRLRQPDGNAVLIHVSGGIGDYEVLAGKVEVKILDWDIWDHNTPEVDEAISALQKAFWSGDRDTLLGVVDHIDGDMPQYEEDKDPNLPELKKLLRKARRYL